MNLKITIFFLLSIFFFAGCEKDTIVSDTHTNPKTVHLTAPAEEFEKGWVRVKFNHLDNDLNTTQTRSGGINTGIPEIDEIAAALGATKVERVFNEGGKYKERRRKYGLHLWYDFYVGEQQPVTRAISSFAELPSVELVELIPVDRQSSSAQNKFGSALSIFNPGLASGAFTTRSTYGGDGFSFNDPFIKRQWHYYNDGSTANSIAGADANIFPAWKVTTGNPEIIVAVVDGGVDFSHPDLAQNMWVNKNEIPGNNIDDDKNGYVDDIYGFVFGRKGIIESTGAIVPMDHGTHCAGTIAAVNNNGVGLAGVAGGNGNPATGVRLMSCQTYVPDPEYPDDPHGESISTSQTPDAFAYAADNGALIANCSFSYGGTKLSSAYKAGIDYFVDNAGTDENGKQTGPMKGGLMIAASGNDGKKDYTLYPGSYNRVVNVANSMSNYQMAPTSNYGFIIDVTAPGGSTSSSYAPDNIGGIFSTIAMESINYTVEKGYSYKSGTSMAAPHVSGIAALVLSTAVEKNIPITLEKLRSIIEQSCWSLDKYNPEYIGMLGHGQVNAGRAIQILMGEDQLLPLQQDKIKIRPYRTSLNLSWEVPGDYFDNPIVATEIYISTNPLEGVDFEKLPEGIKMMVMENNKKIGEAEEKLFLNLNPNTEYHIALVTVDRQMLKSKPAFITEKTKNETGESDGHSEFKLFPNPVKDYLSIGFPETSFGKKVAIEMYNASGYRAYTHEVIGKGTPSKIYVERLTPGTYTVVLKYLDVKEKQTIIKY